MLLLRRGTGLERLIAVLQSATPQFCKATSLSATRYHRRVAEARTPIPSAGAHPPNDPREER